MILSPFEIDEMGQNVVKLVLLDKAKNLLARLHDANKNEATGAARRAHFARGREGFESWIKGRP